MHAGLFQLGAQFWLSPTAVGAAIKVTPYEQLAMFVGGLAPALKGEGFEPTEVNLTDLESAARDLRKVLSESSYTLEEADGDRDRFARIIGDISNTAKWEKMIRRHELIGGLKAWLDYSGITNPNQFHLYACRKIWSAYVEGDLLQWPSELKEAHETECREKSEWQARQTVGRFMKELTAGGSVTADKENALQYELIRLYLIEVKNFLGMSGGVGLNLEEILKSKWKEHKSGQKLNLISMVQYRRVTNAKMGDRDWRTSETERVLKFDEGLVSLWWEDNEEARRAMEVLRKERWPLAGSLFKAYVAASDREAKVEATRKRALDLLNGAPLGDLEDPFEVIAVLRLCGSKRPEMHFLLSLLDRKVVPVSPDVYSRPFTIYDLPVVKPFYEVVHVSTAEKYAEAMREIATPEGLHQKLTGYKGNKSAQKVIQKKLNQLKSSSDTEEMIEVAENILRGLHDLLEKETQEVIQGIDAYYSVLLMALTYWKSPLREEYAQDIVGYDKENAMQGDIYRLLDRLWEFFGVDIPNTKKALLGSNHMVHTLERVKESLKEMMDKKERAVQSRGALQLIPSHDRLDALFGYIAENCLGNFLHARHFLEDPGFILYRMAWGGEWRGVVQTFTRQVSIGGEGKKLLLVVGVDPDLSFTPDPKALLDGIDEGFSRIGEEGDYDFVVVPKEDFAQSSRRALLRNEFYRYQQVLVTEEPAGFPYLGPSAKDRSPIYYAEEKEFLVLWESFGRRNIGS